MRRFAKYLLFALGGLVALCLVLMAIVLVTFDDEDYRRLVTHGVKLFTGYSVAIEGPFALTVSAEPSLTAESIRFRGSAKRSPPPVTSIGKLHIQIALKPLLRGVLFIRKLMAEDVVMAIALEEETEAEDGKAPSGRSVPDIQIPVMESVRLRNIRLDVINAPAGRTVEIRLQNFDIDDIRDAGPLFISGEGSVSDNDFKINGQLGALAAMLKGVEPFPVDLNLTSPGFELSIAGTVEDVIDGEGLELKLSGEAGELSNLFKLIHMEVPPLGHVKLEAAVARNIDAPKVNSFNIKLFGDSRVGFEASGAIANAITGEGADIRFSGSCENQDILKLILPKRMPGLNRLRVSGQLSETQGEIAIENLVVEAAGQHGLSVAADGRMGLGDSFAMAAIGKMEVSASIEADDTRMLFDAFGVEGPELGAFSLQALIRGTAERFELTEIDARTAHAGGLKVGLKGTIGFEKDPERGLMGTMDLQASADAPTTSDAFTPLGITGIPRMRTLRARARVRGTTEALSLSDIAFRAGQSGSLRLEISGAVGRLPLTGERSISDVKLTALVRAKSTSVLSQVLGIAMPDLGPLNATGRIVDRKDIIGLRDMDLLVGDEKKPNLKVTGAVVSVLRNYKAAVNGIALSVEARNLSLKAFSEKFAKQLTDLGPVSGSFQIAGTPEELALSKISLSAASPLGFSVTATGGVKGVRLKNTSRFQGVDVSLSATAPNAVGLGELVGFELPDLGQVQISAKINDGGGSLDVKPFDIRSGSGDKATFHLKGQIQQVTEPKQIAMQATFETASRIWAEKYLQRPQADDLPLKGMIKIRGTVDGLIIDEARLGTSDGKALMMKAEGRITRHAGSPTIDVQLTASAPDPQVISSMADVSLPVDSAFAVNGRINGNPRKVDFNGNIRIGKTAFRSKVSGAFSGKRPRIDGKFVAQTIYLEDIGLYPGAPAEDASQPPVPQSSKRTRLFDDKPLSFDALKAVDLHLDFDADQLIGRHITIKKVDLDVQLEKGRLRIQPVSMVYAAGYSESEFVIDASGKIPTFVLKVSGEDIDVDDMLAYLHEPIIISGSLNLVVDLQTSGRSPREIASNLQGEIAMALENGRIRRIIDFLSLDAFDVLLNVASRSTHTDLHCMINQVHFENGVGEIEVFYMDSPRVRARGAGSINLAAETVDVVLYPEAKRRLFRRGSPVRISGPLLRPSVRVVPGAEAAMLAGDILMPYVTIPKRILGLLWSLIRRDRSATPCVFENQ